MSLFVFEKMDKPHQRKVFTLFGVDYYFTKRTWINLPLMLGAGIVLALIFSAEKTIPMKVLSGIGYGFLIIFTMFCHGIGGIISSRLVHAPVSSIIMTATVNIMHYDDQGDQPSRVHLGRSLGSPIFNLLLGLIALGIYHLAVQNQFIGFFGWANIILGIFTLMPIPSLDGAVILRELSKRGR